MTAMPILPLDLQPGTGCDMHLDRLWFRHGRHHTGEDSDWCGGLSCPALGRVL